MSRPIRSRPCLRPRLATVLLGGLIAGLAAAGPPSVVRSESFDGPELPEAFLYSVSEGWSIAIEDGRLRTAKDAGITAGAARATRCGELVIGDFSITVDVDADAPASLGIVLLHPQTYGPLGFTDIFFTAADSIASIIGVPGSPSIVSVPTTATSARFRLDRSGETITLSYDLGDGAGFVVLQSAGDPVLAEPLGVQLFHLEEGASGTARLGRFDELVLEADGFGDVGFDLFYDGVIDVQDLLRVLAGWGACEQACCLADFDRDGAVGISDLLLLLAEWS